jgi:hypothetical protein
LKNSSKSLEITTTVIFFLSLAPIFFCIIFICLQHHLNSYDTIRRVNVQCSEH